MVQMQKTLDALFESQRQRLALKRQPYNVLTWRTFPQYWFSPGACAAALSEFVIDQCASRTQCQTEVPTRSLLQKPLSSLCADVDDSLIAVVDGDTLIKVFHVADLVGSATDNERTPCLSFNMPHARRSTKISHLTFLGDTACVSATYSNGNYVDVFDLEAVDDEDPSYTMRVALPSETFAVDQLAVQSTCCLLACSSGEVLIADHRTRSAVKCCSNPSSRMLFGCSTQSAIASPLRCLVGMWPRQTVSMDPAAMIVTANRDRLICGWDLRNGRKPIWECADVRAGEINTLLSIGSQPSTLVASTTKSVQAFTVADLGPTIGGEHGLAQVAPCRSVAIDEGAPTILSGGLDNRALCFTSLDTSVRTSRGKRGRGVEPTVDDESKLLRSRIIHFPQKSSNNLTVTCCHWLRPRGIAEPFMIVGDSAGSLLVL